MTAPGRGYTTADSFLGLLSGLDVCLDIGRRPNDARISQVAVSQWSVGQHLEHLLLADRGILDWVAATLAEPDLPGRAEDPNEIGRQILLGGSIPRGRGPAPPFTIPTGLEGPRLTADLQELRGFAAGLEPKLDEVDASLHTLPHHLLGHFTPAEWLRFLHIHHLHHESIIRDILAA